MLSLNKKSDIKPQKSWFLKWVNIQMEEKREREEALTEIMVETHCRRDSALIPMTVLFGLQ